MDLPAGVAGAAFESPAQLEGRVLVAPVGDGQLLQLGAVSDQVGGEPAAEVSITLGRDLAVDGRLRPGDTVDVFATEDETTLAATGLQVVRGHRGRRLVRRRQRGSRSRWRCPTRPTVRRSSRPGPGHARTPPAGRALRRPDRVGEG